MQKIVSYKKNDCLQWMVYFKPSNELDMSMIIFLNLS